MSVNADTGLITPSASISERARIPVRGLPAGLVPIIVGIGLFYFTAFTYLLDPDAFHASLPAIALILVSIFISLIIFAYGVMTSRREAKLHRRAATLSEFVTKTAILELVVEALRLRDIARTYMFEFSRRDEGNSEDVAEIISDIRWIQSELASTEADSSNAERVGKLADELMEEFAHFMSGDR